MPETHSHMNSEVLSVRRGAGYRILSDFSIIELSGKDAESFLQGRTSNDLRALSAGQGQLSALLDRKGYIIAFVSVHRLAPDLFWILSDSSQSKLILAEFSTYHFREQITYREISENFKMLAIQGPASEAFLAGLLEHVPAAEYSLSQCSISELPCLVQRRSFCGDCGFVVVIPEHTSAKLLETLKEKLRTARIDEISADAFETLRIEAGIPLFGKDMSQENLLPETGLEQYAASYSKGCFQGQEVLARIKTYGAPRRALVGLIFEAGAEQAFALDTEFSVAGEEAGRIKSNIYSPTLDQFIALAYVNRDYRVPEKKLAIDTASGAYNVTVKFLPFYSAGSTREKAKKQYDLALQEFAHGSEEKAISLLRQVVELDPLLTDAYESLGVILSRQEQYDEAIALMHKLMSLDPESVMAHTNLSVYYMQLGDKERAEEEKAIAMSIRMTQLAKEHARQKKVEADREKLAEEAERRLDMFRQVLVIDPDDFLANNGVGTVYVELGQYAEAIPYLLKCIAIKATHTVAYLALGEAYEKLARFDDAANIFRKGIELAAKRGDLTPMKEMQGRLAALEGATTQK